MLYYNILKFFKCDCQLEQYTLWKFFSAKFAEWCNLEMRRVKRVVEKLPGEMTILFFLLKYYAGTSCVLKLYLWVKVPKNLQALG